MKKPLPFHPILIAIYPIVTMYAFNVVEMPGAEKFVAVLSVAMVVVALVVMGALRLITGDTLKSALLTSLFLFAFFTYGHVYSAFINTDLSMIFAKNRYLFPLWLMMIFVGSILIIRIRKDLSNVTTILNFISVVMIVLTAINIFQSRQKLSSVDVELQRASHTEKSEVEPDAVGPRGVIYVILDGYPNVATLKDTFQCDVSEFTDYLTEKGFYIASKGTSNYMYTPESLSSSLNMKYVDDFIDPLRDRGDLARSGILKYIMEIEDNEVKDVFKSLGYKTIHFSSIFATTNRNRYYDLANQCAGGFEFWFVLLKSTMMTPFSEDFEQISSDQLTECVMNKLPEVNKEESRYFAFAHLDVSHHGWVPGAPQYCSDLNAYNAKLIIMLDKIFSASDKPPAIVLQGDHGTMSKIHAFHKAGGTVNPELLASRDGAVDEMLRERMRIFNAYYLPDGGDALLYEQITPVNTFRVIFNHYFGMDYELLDDVNYFPEGLGGTRRFDFVDVTDRVRF